MRAYTHFIKRWQFPNLFQVRWWTGAGGAGRCGDGGGQEEDALAGATGCISISIATWFDLFHQAVNALCTASSTGLSIFRIVILSETRAAYTLKPDPSISRAVRSQRGTWTHQYAPGFLSISWTLSRIINHLGERAPTSSSGIGGYGPSPRISVSGYMECTIESVTLAYCVSVLAL